MRPRGYTGLIPQSERPSGSALSKVPLVNAVVSHPKGAATLMLHIPRLSLYRLVTLRARAHAANESAPDKGEAPHP